MFTGIIAALGTVVSAQARSGEIELVIEAGLELLAGTRTGDSIAVSGVCLTATRIDGGRFAADVSAESLSKTTLARLAAGGRVNLERALRAGEPLGGHYVSGHVDGLAELVERREENRSLRLTFAVPDSFARFVVPKGSITLEGVSLTVNEVDGSRFGVNLIPHTRELTTLGSLQPGARVNVEVDMLARYVERLLAASKPV